MSQKHLGGHFNLTHIDTGAFRYLTGRSGVQSMLDVGCGPGGMVAYARRMGIHAVGIDGDSQFRGMRDIIIHDYTKGLAPETPGFSHGLLGWSVEFVEHVEEKFQYNYMETFTRCDVVAMTHAPKGFAGWHHVNCQDRDYWISVFESYGFVYMLTESEELRKASTMERNFMRETGCLFLKKDLAGKVRFG